MLQIPGKYKLIGPPIDPLTKKKFKLYAYILYSSMDDELADWISKTGNWLGEISGDDCYIIVFENPKFWGDLWKDHLEHILGKTDFERIYEEWINKDSSYRDLSYKVAENLGIEDTTVFPAIIFVNSLDSKEYLIEPITMEKENFRPYFEKLFSIVRSSIKDKNPTEAVVPADLNKLQSNINKQFKYWEILDKTQRNWKSISRYVNTIKDIEKSVVDIISNVVSIIK